MRTNKSLSLSLLLLFAAALIISACSSPTGEEENIENIEPLTYSFYSGYWDVDHSVSLNTPKRKTSTREQIETKPAFESNKSKSSVSSSSEYHLEFYQPDDWKQPFPITSGETGDDIIHFGEEILIGFSVINSGADMFSIYLDAPEKASVYLNWDGVEYEIHSIIQLQSNHYETAVIPLETFYYDMDLSVGLHEVTFTLDVPGQELQTHTRSVTIEPPEIKADRFEFNESMYIITYDGEYSFGDLSYSNGTLYLDGYGELKVIEDNEDEMIVAIELAGTNKRKSSSEEYQFKLNKQTPVITETEMTNLLMHDVWYLAEGISGKVQAGERFTFTSAGHYDFIHSTAGLTRKAWRYDTEKSIKFGHTPGSLTGTNTIELITQDSLIMKDHAYTYRFYR